MKLFTCSSNIKHILIVLIVLFLSHESNGKKSQYGELLTDDNELFLIEQPAPAAKPKPAQQPHLVVRRSAEAATTHNSSSSSSTHKKSKPSKTVTKTKKAVTKKSKPKTPKTTVSKPIDKNKLIVKIIYASSNNPARSDLTKLVYSTSESLSPCDKNLCKSNEVCILLEQRTATGEDYKCVPKSKLATVSRANEPPKSTPKSRRHRRSLTDKLTECSTYNLIRLKLHLFEIFDSNLNESKHNQTANHNTAIESMFTELDSDSDGRVDLYEWLSWREIEEAQKCADALFYECELDGDRRLSRDEMNECFGGSYARPTCAFVRDLPSNADFAQQFYSQLSLQLSIQLTTSSFAPICDLNGYFKPSQCDNQVTCWCMSKLGLPVPSSLKKISETQFNCDDMN